MDALIAAVPPEMQFLLTQKETAKEAWDAIAAARIGSDRARKSTLQTLRKKWENLAFKPGEDLEDFAFRLNTLMHKLVQFGDASYDKERAIEKLFRCTPRSTSRWFARSSLQWTSPRCRSRRRLVASRLSTPMSHSFPQTLSPLAASSTSLESSGRSAEVTGRRGSLLPRQTAASAASRARRR
jgi:hypothetical protein